MLQAMAEVHLLMRQPNDALALYDDLLERQPTSPKLWNERGVALHQDGRFAEAEESYRRALDAEPAYAIAHNNLGVSLYHRGDAEEAIEAFRARSRRSRRSSKARLNLALLLTAAEAIPARARGVPPGARRSSPSIRSRGTASASCSPSCASSRMRATRSRAPIQARPDFAEAHYNLSFTLSNLGDFEGALRETKRALELDPYYVAQKFELAIDVEYEDPDSRSSRTSAPSARPMRRSRTSRSIRGRSTRCSRS